MHRMRWVLALTGGLGLAFAATSALAATFGHPEPGQIGFQEPVTPIAHEIQIFHDWLLMPVIPQPQAYHGFADQRNFLSVPRAADVLSNLPFVAVGLFGFWRLARTARPLSGVAHTSLFVFFTGFFLTGFGSGYYHWDPNDARLVLDRLPMTIAFAGLLGALVAERISQRSGLAMLFLILVVGPASVL